jgi:hypothetical protein
VWQSYTDNALKTGLLAQFCEDNHQETVIKRQSLGRDRLRNTYIADIKPLALLTVKRAATQPKSFIQQKPECHSE